MTKNFKLSFLFYVIFFGIISAYLSLSYSLIWGVGLNTVALIVLLGLSVSMFIVDKQVRKRTKDIFIVACCFMVFELLTYFALEFDFGSTTTRAGFYDYQTFLSILGLIFLIYTIFRFIVEFKGVKITPIEFILGNITIERKPKIKSSKTNKELTNGSLEEKPNHAIKDAQRLMQVDATEEERATLDGQLFIGQEADDEHEFIESVNDYFLREEKKDADENQEN